MIFHFNGITIGFCPLIIKTFRFWDKGNYKAKISSTITLAGKRESRRHSKTSFCENGEFTQQDGRGKKTAKPFWRPLLSAVLWPKLTNVVVTETWITVLTFLVIEKYYEALQGVYFWSGINENTSNWISYSKSFSSSNLKVSIESEKLLVFSATPFKIHQNKKQNRSIDKVQNLGNERR